MEIKIHRGENQIGGNIIQISTASTKILFDVGLELDQTQIDKLPEISGLFDESGFDAIVISHYHSDHLGLAYKTNKDIPIFMGESSFKIVSASDKYKSVQTISPSGFLKHNTPFTIGDITVTPYLCDHSAFDRYMLLAESNGEKILYTGDFRSIGRKSYQWLLDVLPNKIDILICEGTTLSREDFVLKTESELEAEAFDKIHETTGPIFVLQSSMNIDRIVTLYRAGKRNGRIFLQDLYMAEITSAIGGHIPNPIDFEDVNVFITHFYSKDHFRYALFDKYGSKKISKSQVTSTRFVMCVRTLMLRYLKSLNKKMSFDNGILFYSFWSGYRRHPEMTEFLSECEKMGLKIITLHTSGHADKSTILRLIERVNPDRIIPIHTENPKWFELISNDQFRINN